MIDKKKIDLNNDSEVLLDNEVLKDNEDISLKDYDINKYKIKLIKFKKIKIMLIIIGIFLVSLLYISYSVLFYYKTSFRGDMSTGGLSEYSYIVGKIAKEYVLDKLFSKQDNNNVHLNLLNISLDTQIGKLNIKLKNFLSSPTSYVDKKQILANQVDILLSKIKKSKKYISELVNNISNYAFLPEQIDKLIQGGDITNILYVVDGLKIMSLMNLYKYIPTYMQEFIEGVGKGFFRERTLSCKELELVKRISYYVDRGDRDVKNFLKMCYLNPYEDDWIRCNNGEFDYYYNNVLKIGKKFDTAFFKRLIAFIISKLQDNSYSNIQVIFNSLNPKTKEISFSTIIRTYQEDIEGINSLILSNGKCIDKGLNIQKLYNGINNLKNIINNLHVYLIITYLNFLRQSHMIEGDNIKINQLKVNVKKNKDGIVYNESNFNFKVKVQPEVIREIYDFIYSSK